MKPLPFIILICLLAISCNSEKKKIRNNKIDLLSEVNSTNTVEKIKVVVNLNDTLANGKKIIFKHLINKEFDSLEKQIVRTSIPNDHYNSFIKETNKYIIIALENGKNDTLKEIYDGDYYEKYQVLKYWKEKNQLLVKFLNWEEENDFFINLKTGSYYYTGNEYIISPKKDLFFSYNDISINPLGLSEYLITEVSKDSLKTILKVNLEKKTITFFEWIGEYKGIITIAEVEDTTYRIANKTNYLMTIE